MSQVCALGALGYWRDPLNRFDGIVVVIGLLDVGSAWVHVGVNAQVLRAFRLLRVLKLLRSWPSLQRLFAALQSLAIEDFFDLILLLGLILFIFALLGAQLFSGQYLPPAFEAPPRTNFDSIGSAMITVFVIAIGEAWDHVWVDTKVAVGSSAALYFVALIICANYMLLNLVVALLIGSFEDSKDGAIGARAQPSGLETGRSPLVHSDGEQGEEGQLLSEINGPPPAEMNRPLGWRGVHGPTGVNGPLGWLGRTRSWMRAWLAAQAADDRAFWLFEAEHPLRRAASALIVCRVESAPLLSFDNAIIMVIVLSSITLCFEDCYLDETSEFAAKLRRVDALVMAVFVIELLLKALSRVRMDCFGVPLVESECS